MKRIAAIGSFCLLGALFALLVQGAAAHFLVNNLYESGSDEAGEPWLKNLLVGAPLCAVLWGWVGNTLVKNWRLGASMLAGIGVATLLAFGVPMLRAPLMGIFSFSGNVLGMVAWSLLLAAFAYAGLYFGKRLTH